MMWAANPNEAISDLLLCEVTRRLARASEKLELALLELFEAYFVLRHPHKDSSLKFDIVKQIVNVASVMDVEDVARIIIRDDNACITMKFRKYMSHRIAGLTDALQRWAEAPGA